ncbi:MAG: T9SS type A sorting domain-containing protein, partial [candidate division Zixibacteria bacterium]|nr:T9SS type A sorting domain-containing protein [candidate division Zixibacteria bacterium]
FTLWSHFDTLDISSSGYSNAELYISTSTDSGEDWAPFINLTDTFSDSCVRGECNSEHWSSMAEVADDSIYILYIEDKDAGSISKTEGQETINPVRYLAVPTDSLLLTSVEEDNSIPANFELSQNYPNPFNSSTTFSYSLSSSSDVKLEIYNLLGENVTTLINSVQETGEHSITWDASEYSSGIYFYRLTTGDKSYTKRMVLLK